METFLLHRKHDLEANGHLDRPIRQAVWTSQARNSHWTPYLPRDIKENLGILGGGWRGLPPPSWFHPQTGPLLSVFKWHERIVFKVIMTMGYTEDPWREGMTNSTWRCFRMSSGSGFRLEGGRTVCGTRGCHRQVTGIIATVSVTTVSTEPGSD